MSLHAYACRHELLDLSAPGQPFGVQWKGLAFAPDKLVPLGYSLIHSVNTDESHDERSLRDYYARLRRPVKCAANAADQSGR